MSLPLVWMADALRAAGCTVIEEPGWKTRGRPRSFAPIGIMFHHDASPDGETSNGADVIINGRPGLEGPLGNLWLAYSGTWHCIAAGSANHAGEGDGSWGDIDDGNHDTIGIETDHTTDEQWTTGQRSEALRGTDALRRHMGMSDAQVHRRILAHKEWAPSRKVDPDPMDMDAARANLIAYDPAAEDGFMNRTECKCTVAEAIPANEWTTLRVRDTSEQGALRGVIAGPCGYVLNASVALQRAPQGTAVMLQAVETGHELDDLHTGRDIDMRGAVEDEGVEHFAFAAQGHLAEGEWLRLRVNPAAAVSVTEVRAAVTTY